MLWAVLDSTMPVKLVQTALQRVGDLPLSIRACPGLRRRSVDSSTDIRLRIAATKSCAAFLPIVFPRVAQWKDAHLDLYPDFKERLQSLEQPAPLLERFSFKIQCPGLAPQVDLFQGHCPSLTELSINKLVVPWNSRIFQNLRSISIEDVKQHGPTVEEVIQLIALPPHLKHFSIRALQLSDPAQDVPLVEVPQLESLSVREVGPSSIQHILSRIRAPTLTKLIVNPINYWDVDYQLSTFINVSLGHFEQTIRSAIEHAHSLSISIDLPSRSISVSTSHAGSSSMVKDEYVMLDFYNKAVMESLQLCLGFLLPRPPLCPPITLDILETSNTLESDFHWMLESAINDRVTEVCLRAYGDCTCLSFLCTARDCGGIAKWPFPRLRKLTLPRCISGEEAVCLIRQRYAPDTSKDFNQILPFTSGDFVFEPVDRLIELDLQAVMFDDADYDRLASIVGMDVLVIGGDSGASDGSDTSDDSDASDGSDASD